LKLNYDKSFSNFALNFNLRRYITDCNMPILDGWGATREIRKLMGRKTPIIIALTANAMTGRAWQISLRKSDGGVKRGFGHLLS